jgi:hypothetical protein
MAAKPPQPAFVVSKKQQAANYAADTKRMAAAKKTRDDAAAATKQAQADATSPWGKTFGGKPLAVNPQPAAPVANPWTNTSPTKRLTTGKTKAVVPPHPLATPPDPAPKPVVTHPRTIQVTPVPAAPAATPAAAPVVDTTPPPVAPPVAPPIAPPVAPPLDTANKAGFFTTKAGANAAIGKGQTLKFTKGKGFYLDDAPPPAPETANKAGFFTTKAAATAAATKGQTLKFTKGKGYSLTDAPKRVAAAAPAGPTVAQQINAALKAEVDPQTAAINSGYAEILASLKAQQNKARTDAVAQANTVSGYYGALTPLLKGIGPAVQGGYQDAADAIAGAAKGFSGALGDTAAADAAQSQALLAANGAPQAQIDAAAQAAGTGGGAANALYGVGGYIPSAALSAQGAAFGAAARQLPATNAGVGAQNAAQAIGVGAANARDIGTTISQAGLKHADDLATLAAGVPKLRNDITSQFATLAQGAEDLSLKRKQQQLSFILSTGINPLTGQLTPSARAQIASITGTDPTTGRPTLATVKAQAAADTAAANATNTANAITVRAQTVRETAAARASQNSFTNRLSFVRTWGYDPITHDIAPGFKQNADGTVTKITKGAAKKGGLSDSQAAKMVTQWHDGTPKSVTTIARDAAGNPIPKANSTAPETTTQTVLSGQMKYEQAYKMLRTFGKGDVEARRLLNTVYRRGDSGRAWVTNEEQYALRKAGLSWRAAIINGHAVLNAKQVAALTKAGVALPPGQHTAEGYLVIAPGF